MAAESVFFARQLEAIDNGKYAINRGGTVPTLKGAKRLKQILGAAQSADAMSLVRKMKRDAFEPARDEKGQFASTGAAASAARTAAKNAQTHATAMKAVAKKTGNPVHASQAEAADRKAKAARSAARKAEAATTPEEASRHYQKAHEHEAANRQGSQDLHASAAVPKAEQREERRQMQHEANSGSSSAADHAALAAQHARDAGSSASTAGQHAHDAGQVHTAAEAQVHASLAREAATQAQTSYGYAREYANLANEAHENLMKTARPGSPEHSASVKSRDEARYQRDLAQTSAKSAGVSASKAERIAGEKREAEDYAKAREALSGMKPPAPRDPTVSVHPGTGGHTESAATTALRPAHEREKIERASASRSEAGRASFEAQAATVTANSVRSERAHNEAANAHNVAAMRQRHAGNDEKAQHHERMVKEHEQKAEKAASSTTGRTGSTAHSFKLGEGPSTRGKLPR